MGALISQTQSFRKVRLLEGPSEPHREHALEGVVLGVLGQLPGVGQASVALWLIARR